ncbi:MAG: DUF3592 domain-containing protein [Aquabacterium sp.]
MPDDIGKVLIAALVLGIAWLVWHSWRISQTSPAWPHVMGEMLEARARAFNEIGDQSGTPTHEWFTEVRYRYTVDGQTYTGTRLRAFGRRHMDEAQAQQEIAPFQPGTRVKVFYDPAKPASSVLIPG